MDSLIIIVGIALVIAILVVWDAITDRQERDAPTSGTRSGRDSSGGTPTGDESDLDRRPY